MTLGVKEPLKGGRFLYGISKPAPSDGACRVGGCRSVGRNSEEDEDAAAGLGALQGSGQASLPALPEHAQLFTVSFSTVWESPHPHGFRLKWEGGRVLPLARHSLRGLGSRAGMMSHLQAAVVS